jgi:LmbE family N-acetylglucosaminyl deacetylase
MKVSPLCADKEGLALPAMATGAISGVLELDVRSSFAGRLFDPAVEISAGEFRDVQYFERGVQGTRFLNVTRLLKYDGRAERICVRGRHVAGRFAGARLHVCDEKVAADERVLVIGAHPDDAEIAAFGLYSDTRATVVTLTAGDASDRYRNRRQPWLSLSRNEIARTRVLDSLTIPKLGGVSPDRAINLCFPDGRLRDLYRRPDIDLWNEAGAIDFSALRRMNHSSLLRPGTCAGSWRALVRDLSHIVASVDPTIVVAPHPKLDPHPDHLFTTVALCEALAAGAKARMFLYVVHNTRSEMWPFGPAGSGVTLPPILPGDGQCGSGFYSHALPAERQRLKLLALEAMHDLRDLQWPASPGAEHRAAGERIVRELKAWVHGMGVDPTSYLRRAVRPDEFFFVASCQDACAMARQAIDRQAIDRQAVDGKDLGRAA